MLIIADQGKEFVGTQFEEVTNANSILLHIIDVRAPWQNGRTERHGDIYKTDFRSRSLDALSEQSRGASALGYGRIDWPTVQATLLSSE